MTGGVYGIDLDRAGSPISCASVETFYELACVAVAMEKPRSLQLTRRAADGSWSVVTSWRVKGLRLIREDQG